MNFLLCFQLYFNNSCIFQVFQIAYVIVKAANSPRPGNWILERSLDGVDYQPWQYYAITDSECLTRYNIHPRPGTPSYVKDDEVICTSYYSKIHPLENGEVRSDGANTEHSRKKPSLVNWQICLQQTECFGTTEKCGDNLCVNFKSSSYMVLYKCTQGLV